MIIRGPADSIPDLTSDAGKYEKRNTAGLAKEYHPEEHPKEFNQIQEAYQLLTGRGDGENWSSDAGDDWFSKGEETEPDREPEEQWESYTQDFGHITAWEFLRSGLPGSCSGCHFLE